MIAFHVAAFERPETISAAAIAEGIAEIARLPQNVKDTVARLSEEQLAAKTLPGVWSVIQVIHHMADSHMNAFIRCKLAMTENSPVIKPYEEGDWARLADAKDAPVQFSIDLLTALHARWALLLGSLRNGDWKRAYFHPDQKRNVPLEEVVLLYAWHGRNHLAHIHALMAARGWIQ